jgi:uncharacterized repeat protein (TIGR01451 family)
MAPLSPTAPARKPSRRGRRGRRLTASIGAALGALALVLALVIPALGVHDATFQLDGNTADDAGAVEPNDWETLFHDSTPATVGGITVGPLPAGYVDAAFVEDWQQEADGDFDNYDGTTFTTGAKDTLEINTGWTCVEANNVTDKGDITNAYATIVEIGGERILYFGLEKTEDNGDNNVGLWVLQNDVSCPAGSNPPGTNFSGTHADGDLFLVAAFTNGGGVSNITAYEWSTALGGIDPTPVAGGGDCSVAAGSDSICATTNAESTGGSEFSPAWTHFSKSLGVNGGLQTSSFFEGGINLTDFEEFEDACFTGFLFNTRASQSLTAALYDYAQGDIDTCAPALSLDKEPETGTHNVGDSFNWTLEVTNDGDGDATDALVEDTIPDGLTINTVTVAPASAGTCDVTGQDIECTIDVAASDGNTTAPEPDVVTITVNVTSTTEVFEGTEAGCVNVNNTGTVEHADDTTTGDDSDTVEATICRPLVSKTAAGSYTHDVQWTIDKSVDINQHTMLAGQNADSTYTVSVNKTVTDSAFAVSGTITVQNPNLVGSMTVDVTDALSSGQSATAAQVNCGAAGDGDDAVIAANSSINCTYTLNPANANSGTNTATATLNGIGFTGTANYTFTPTNTGEPETINVTDNFDGGGATAINGPVSDDTTFDTYTHNFACPTDETLYDASGHYEDTFPNTAEIVETTDESSETVNLDCYIPTITKTADGSFTHGVNWTITKDVDISQHTMLAGENADSTYTVSVDKEVTDSNFVVAGTITIGNPSTEDDMTVDVTDVLSTGESAAATDIDCETSGGGLPDEDGDNLVIPFGESIECFYAINAPDADPGTNTATATFSNNAAVEVSDTDGYTFTANNEGEPETINVTDNFDGGGAVAINGPVSVDTTFATYTHNFACPTDETLYDSNGHYEDTFPNTAEIVETTDEDSESVDLDCYIPTISKSADGSFDRDWDWTIEKVADQTTLNLQLGQSFLVNYTVTVDPTATDSEFEVTGSITVGNDSPEDAMTVDVTDALSTGQSLTALQIDCGAAGDGDNAVIPAGGSISCDYDFTDVPGVDAGDDGTNTATAVFSNDANVSVSDTDGYSYDLDSETDECIDVSDTLGGDFRTVCADDDPADFVFEYMYDVVQNECGEHEVPNTASFETNDQDGEDDDTGSDNWNVTVTIECQEGCTLTQGYWKTHSEFGPAPEDEDWYLIGDFDGDGTSEGPGEQFYLSGQTWYQVFWTKPAGNAYYILAKQYMAALLNIASGADSPASVDAAITAADALFDVYTPAEIGALKGNKQPRPQFISAAGTLGAYNEGTIGPGHCDEDSTSSRQA